MEHEKLLLLETKQILENQVAIMRALVVLLRNNGYEKNELLGKMTITKSIISTIEIMSNKTTTHETTTIT